MKTLIFGFSTPKKKMVFAELIAWWDSTFKGATKKMTHGYCRFTGRAWDRDFIYQAQGFKTNFMGSRLFESINEVVEEYELDVSDELEAKVGQTCLDREGIAYGIKQVIGNILANLGFIITFGHWEPRNPFADGEKSVTCIEEIGWLISKDLGMKPPDNLESMGVWEFRNFFAALPGVRVRKI